VTRDTGELCAWTGILPEAIEPHLLTWVEAGWIEYRGAARGLRLEPLPVPDLSARVRELLQRMEAIDEARLMRLDEYVQASACRHAFLSTYFGQPLHDSAALSQKRCGACDNCCSRLEGVHPTATGETRRNALPSLRAPG
jgi:hypothetical protein